MAPPASQTRASSSSARRGLARLLSDDELDEFFRVNAELRTYDFGISDAQQLVPMLTPIYSLHRGERKAEGAGGLIDVGANIGKVSAAVINAWTRHDERFYHHALGDIDIGGKLVDAEHPIDHHDELAFTWLLEASPLTRMLLQRHFDAAHWVNSHVVIKPIAAGTTTGTHRFCFYAAGSGNSGLAQTAKVGESGGRGDGGDGVRNCTDVPVTRLTDLVNRDAGSAARVFFLKIDVEGAEALVLAGARELFVDARVAFVLFENHNKWAHAQEDLLGVSEFISVGRVVRDFRDMGYRCFYTHSRGLIPFLSEGTADGDRARPKSICHEGLPFCARHRIYNRQFWSNVFCAAPTEVDSLDWLLDAYVPPGTTRESLLATFTK